MTTTAAPSAGIAGRQPRRGRRPVLLIGAAVVIAVVAVTIGMLVSGRGRHDSASGSEKPATDTRVLPSFTALDLAGTNGVIVQLGTPQQVVVHADSNLLDNVLTSVTSGVLTVNSRGNFTTHSPMTVVVTVPSLRAVTLSGTGELTVTGAATSTFTARLPGTGTLTASGQVDRVDAALTGAGTLMLASLRARDATVVLRGTGTVVAHATRSLHATLAGTGTITYAGNPGVRDQEGHRYRHG
jgi:Putative auto-transporter adhesin, head GIN domain